MHRHRSAAPAAGPPGSARRPARALAWAGAALGALGTLAVLAAMVGSPPADALGSEPAIAVVVGKGITPVSSLSPTLIEGIYARKRRLWDDRSPILAVNLPAAHPLRRRFSLWIFRRTPEEMQHYWSDEYFQGVVPPPVLGSEEAVLRFVSATPGAIGYVSACTADHRVEIVATFQPPEGGAGCPH